MAREFTPKTSQYCDRCGMAISPGHVRYILTISLTADFDGCIDDDPAKSGLEQAMSQAGEKSEKDLMNEVHEKMAYVLCAGCRKSFARSPFGHIELDETGATGVTH